MPELPEVETVKTQLEKKVIGKTFSLPQKKKKKRVRTPLSSFKEDLEGKKILSLSRRGKYLLFHLSDDRKLIFHLRMEGKLYLVDKEHHSSAHLSLFLPFQGEDDGLAFYDVRKFGVVYYLKEKEEGPLSVLGKEPFEIHDSRELYQKIHKKNKRIKEVLLDQSIRCGIGNIYADEILFKSGISPFQKGNLLKIDDVKRIIDNAKEILSLAIEHNGSTVRSYQASKTIEGSYQDFLKVYGKQGQLCPKCHRYHIEKKQLSGRGTSYCPHCQNVGISVCITGKIASGKSLATSYFQEEGFIAFSADDEIHRMYQEKEFKAKIKANFPFLFTPYLNKKKISKLLHTDKRFRRQYEAFLYRELKERMFAFFLKNNGKKKVFEIPLVFDASMEKLFTYLVGVETTKQREHLLMRGEDPDRASFNKLNSYDQHREELDYILKADGTKEELKENVKKLIEKL